MIETALLLLAAALAYVVSSLLRVSSIPIFILAGIALSPIDLIQESGQIQQILLLGLTFLVFIAGTTLSPQRISNQFRTAVLVGIIQFTTLGFISFILAMWAELSLIPSIYLGLAIAASSTLVVVQILRKRRQIYEPLGRMVLGVLLVQDLIAILFISLLSADNLEPVLVGLHALSVLGIAALSWMVQKKIAPYLFMDSKFDEETLLLISLSILFVFAFLANSLDLPFIVGAFFAGFSLSAFPIHGIVQSQLNSLSDFFLAIFFVSLGTTLVMPENLGLAVAMIILVIVFTPIIVVLIAERAGLSTRGAIDAGLLLAQTSEFSIVIGLIGFEAGHIDQQLLSLIALVTVTTMMATPFFATGPVTWRLTRLRPYVGPQKEMGRPRRIAILGCGSTVRNLVERLDPEILKEILIVDHDPGALKKISHPDVELCRGDAADFRVLTSCGATSAQLIVSTINNIADNQSIVKFFHGKKVVVRVLEDHDAALIRQQGGIPVVLSQLSSDQAVKWFQEWQRGAESKVNRP